MAHQIHTGGGEIYAWHLAQSLAEHHRVSVLSYGQPAVEGNNPKLIRIHPPHVRALDRLSRSHWLIRALWHYLEIYNPFATGSIKKVLLDEKPDLIHSHRLDGLSNAFFSISGAMNIPVVHTLHACGFICPYANLTCPYRKWKPCLSLPLPCRLYMMGNRICTRKLPTAVIGPSRFILNKHREYGFFKNRRVEHIPNSVPDAIPAPESATRRDRPFRAAYVGHMSINKGIRVIMKAWKRMSSGGDIELFLAGDGPLSNDVSRFASSDSRVYYSGPIHNEQMVAFLVDKDVILVPSVLWENHPITIMEAYRSGIPVIGSRSGGIPETVKDGETGILIEPDDPDSLADAVISLANNSGKLADLKKRAFEVSTTGSMRHHVQDILSLYRDLLNP